MFNTEWQTGSADGYKKYIKRNKYQWPQKQQKQTEAARPWSPS